MTVSDEFISSIGTTSDFEGSDSEYLSLAAGGKPKQTVKEITPELIDEIAKSLESRVYPFEPGSSEFLRTLHADRRFCPFCHFETSGDIVSLREHLRQHSEIKDFLESGYRRRRRLEGLAERRRQCQESMERLRVEANRLSKEISEFDAGSMGEQERQCSRLSRLLNGWQ